METGVEITGLRTAIGPCLLQGLVPAAVDGPLPPCQVGLFPAHLVQGTLIKTGSWVLTPSRRRCRSDILDDASCRPLSTTALRPQFSHSAHRGEFPKADILADCLNSELGWLAKWRLQEPHSLKAADRQVRINEISQGQDAPIVWAMVYARRL